MTKREIDYLALVFILAAVFVIFLIVNYPRLSKPAPTLSLQDRLNKLSPQNSGQVVIPASTGIVAGGFNLPADWPESNPQIVNSYLASYTTSSPQQITIVYISKMSLAQNFSGFENYFKSHNWKILNFKNGTELVFLNASKGNSQAQVVIVKTDKGVRVTFNRFSQGGVTGVE